MVLRSINSPTTTLFASTQFSGAGGGEFTITSKKYAYQGANNIQLQVIDDLTVGSPATVTTAGGAGVSSLETAETPLVDRRVEVHIIPGTATLAHVRAAIIGDPDTNALVDMTIDTAGDAFAVPITRLEPGVDDLVHILPASELTAFFDASTDNLLRAGDGLGIYYSGSGFDRHRRITSRNDTGLVAADLFNSRQEPVKAVDGVGIFLSVSDHGYLNHSNQRLDSLSSTVVGGVAGLTAHLADVANPHQVTAAQVDVQGGSERLVAQLNTGSVLLTGTRVGVATTTTRGAIKTSNNAGGDPIAISTLEKAAASGVASLTASTKVAVPQLFNEAFGKTVGLRYARTGSGILDLINVSAVNMDFVLDGEAADGTYNDEFFSNGTYPSIRLSLGLNEVIDTGEGTATFNVDLYYIDLPGTGAISTGPLTETLSIPEVGAGIVKHIDWTSNAEGGSHVALDIPYNPRFFRIETNMTSGHTAASAITVQWAEILLYNKKPNV